MFTLDMRTALLSFILISVISIIFIIVFLQQFRNRNKGGICIILSFFVQTIGLLLVLLRGHVSMWLSFDVSNTLTVAGLVLLFKGLEASMEKSSSIIPDILLLLIFTFIQTWFTYKIPNPGIRTINLSLANIIVSLRFLWLLYHQERESGRQLNYLLIITFIIIGLINLARIISYYTTDYVKKDFLAADNFEVAMILLAQAFTILYAYSIMHLISNRLLNDIKSEEEKFKKVFFTSPYATIISRLSDGHIIDINNAFMRKTGYSEKDLIGNSTDNINLYVKKEDRYSIIDEIYRTGGMVEKEVRLRKKSGEEIFCLFSSAVITINKEKCFFSSIDDITERKNYEGNLLLAKKKAEENDKLKTAFIHNISHEIRTPLNAIVGFSSLLGDPSLDEASKKLFIDTIIKGSDHLLSFVSNILEISNIEAGILKLNRLESNLNSIITNLYEQYKPVADRQGIEFRFAIGLPDFKTNILIDKPKLVQTLTNLLQNAFKFTEKGYVEFGYNLRGDHLEFYVEDTGIGIEEDKHEKIFERFYQVDYSGSRKYEGLGLGLSITKAYADLAGNRIWLSSKPNEGTTFYFTVPYLKAQTEIVKHENSLTGEKSNGKSTKTVLITEDTDSNYRLLEIYLASEEFKIVRAKDGREAVDLCKTEEQIDLILMDIKMPDMDGFEATRQIHGILPNVPVIAHTAYATEADKKKIFSSGFTGYIAKPYSRDDLLATVNKFLKQYIPVSVEKYYDLSSETASSEESIN